MSRAPQTLQDFKPVPARQHDVENHQVESLRLREKKSFLPAPRHGYVVFLRRQPLLHGFGDLRLVLHHKDAHTSTLKVSRSYFLVRSRSESFNEAHTLTS